MTEPSVSLAADTSGMPEFRNEGANWKANRLYYFGVDTGISYQRDARHPNMFRVAYTRFIRATPPCAIHNRRR